MVAPKVRKFGNSLGVVDSNERTGFVVGILFLELNGYSFKTSEEDAAQTVLSLAAGQMDEAAYAAFLQAHTKRVRCGSSQP